MCSWMRVFLLLCAFGMAMITVAAAPGQFSDELDNEQYDCLFGLKTKADLSATSRFYATLEQQDERHMLVLVVTRTTLTLTHRREGEETVIASLPSGVVPGSPYALALLRRDQRLLITRGDRIIFQGETPRGGGKLATAINEPGWLIAGARVQRLEPVVFADDFMRTPADPGPWTVSSGKWRLQSAWDHIPQGNSQRFSHAMYAANPFAWVGANPAGGAALCTAGQPYWENYTLTAAVRPGTTGAVGVQVNMTPAGNGIRIRWSPANDRGPDGNRLAIYQLLDGRVQLLAHDPGGYVPEQWYRLAVESTETGVRVLVDGHERLSVPHATPWRGGVGLYCEGKTGATFDDVTVYGNTLHADLLLESRQSRIKDRFRNDMNGMQKWTSTRSDWQHFPGAPGLRLHQWDIAGSQWLVLSVKPMKLTKGELILVLNGDGKNPTSGYRAVMQPTDNPEEMCCTLYRGDDALACRPCYALPFGKEYLVRFRHEDARLQLEIDDDVVLEAADAQPLTGTRPAYAASGCFALAHDVMMMGRHTLDYAFSEAPVDWFSAGTWMPSNRWSCSPQWSFLSGWSTGDAVLWHKQRFIGDHSIQVFVGLKMEYPGMTATEDERMRDLAVTLCGDGHNPRSGYAAIYAASTANDPKLGKRAFRTILLRNGVEVASLPGPNLNGDRAHQHWFELELRKRGNLVEFFVEGEEKPRLSYLDPDPLEGGVPALWTTDNGINVARVRLHATHTPLRRSDAHVVIDCPWQPEWACVGKPVAFDFSRSWSSSGTPIHMSVTARQAPAGETPATVNISGARVTITARQAGEHWYQVRAVDADGHASPFYDLKFKVFDASKKRNDAHAVVLYRFTEGQGTVIRDHSAIGARADLLIPPGAKTRWLPGQGLAMHGSIPAITRQGVEKLMAIARKKAMTVECWVSTETIAPNDRTISCLLCWEQSGKATNLALGQRWYDLSFTMSARNTPDGKYQAQRLQAGNAIRPWLQHLAVTWDGKTFSAFVDGKRVATAPDRSAPTPTWTANAPLILGNNATGKAGYMGTFYLVAIHDRCFSAADVQQHYAAGPAAQ